MDGQRRLARPLRRFFFRRGDCRLVYRVAARCGALLLLGLSLLMGALQGGHFDDPGSSWARLPDRVASFVGQAAEDIEITGVEQHDPRLTLEAIGVRPGGSLIGFNPARARAQLEMLDWVQEAHVRRAFPNRLIITVTEREAFAIWQKDGVQYVIDRKGKAMSGINPALLRGVIVVSGEKANESVEQLVNQLEAVPDLKQRVTGASRVGMRRWNLYLANGTKILLPADAVEATLQRALDLEQSHQLLSGSAAELDFRIAGETRVAVAMPTAAAGDTTASISPQ
jgi:cell division protein FtsQ